MLKHEKKDLLKLARDAIESEFTNKKVILPKRFNEKRGVFVTLTINKELRGCIGFTEPHYTIEESIVKAAKAAAFHDSRFPSLKEDEFNHIKIEISLLTQPKLISGDKIKEIEIGKDGLIVKYGLRKGLLLPQVATEHNMNAKEFLLQTCLKAGLNPNQWEDENCKVYRFQAEIFSED